MVDTVRSIAALQALLADNESGDITAQNLRDAVVSLHAGSGWADYADNQYTSGSPFALSANTDTVLPNNAGVIRNSELPGDVSAFYSGGKIAGREGDALAITIDFKAVPTNPAATFLEVWFDIGGSVGELYRRIVTFPKGQDVERGVTMTTMVYTLDTWEANGADVYVRCNGTADLYDIRFVVARVHRGQA